MTESTHRSAPPCSRPVAVLSTKDAAGLPTLLDLVSGWGGKEETHTHKIRCQKALGALENHKTKWGAEGDAGMVWIFFNCIMVRTLNTRSRS